MTATDGTGARAIDIGDRVTIGRWGRTVYRVVHTVRVDCGPRSVWHTLEQQGGSRSGPPARVTVEEQRLVRLAAAGATRPPDPPRTCPSCGDSRNPSEAGTCPDCGVPI